MWMGSRMPFPALSPASDVLPKGAPEARPAASKGLRGPSRRQGAQGPFKGAPRARKKQTNCSLHCAASLCCLPATHAHTQSTHLFVYFKNSPVVSKIFLPSNPFQRKLFPDGKTNRTTDRHPTRAFLLPASPRPASLVRNTPICPPGFQGFISLH